jgi:hypothetical protein
MSDHTHKLIKSIENDNNHHILHLTKGIIKSDINDILQKLQFDADKIKQCHKKLDGYRYIKNIDDYEYGRYIRWINLKKVPSTLVNGGIITSIVRDNKIDTDDTDDTDDTPYVCIRVKNNRNRFFCVRSDECLIFQQLSEQEHILLNLMKYLKQ